MIEHNLNMFCGTEHLYQYMRIRLTDGVKYVCENGGDQGAYWLIDAINSYQPDVLKHPMLQEYQFWKLKVNPDKTAVLTCVPDTDLPAIVTQHIEYTDFDLPEIDIWVVDGVAMLKTEY